jgi:hypothetical protein
LDTQDESLEGVEEESCVNSAATSNRQHEWLDQGFQIFWTTDNLLREFSLLDHPGIKRNVLRIFNEMRVKFHR